eukprot:TRINITY_DN910_c0_g1_i3.p1 TRINITY_DN910_c0_g1~~TRINITY_DN910_c0_g1_i3.p1  ORF type:complete len:871 (+),score=428.92 TRINITY_DN910_c0_g1_i3:129-2615(+)
MAPLANAPERYVPCYEFGEKAPRYTKERESKEDTDKARERVLKALDAVPHPKCGGAGSPVDVVTNTVELRFKDNTRIWQYALTVEPAPKGRKMHQAIVDEALSGKMGPSFSCIVAGGIVFANQELKACDGLVFKATDDRHIKVSDIFKLGVKLVREVTTTKIDQELITVFSKLLRSVLDKGPMQKVHRSYFDLNERYTLPGRKLDVVPGLHMTLRPTNFGSGLAVQLDVVHKVISTQTIYQELDVANHKDLRFKVKDTICMTVYEGKDKKKRTVRIDDVDASKDENTPMKELDGKSLKWYFETHYGLKVPKGQPLLVHHKPARPGQDDKDSKFEYYLPSVLSLTGIVPEVYGSQVRQMMTEHCAVKPGPRFAKIKLMAAAVLRPFKEVAGKWGCEAAPGFIIEKARSLPEPVVEMVRGAKMRGASWNHGRESGCITATKPLTAILVVLPKRSQEMWMREIHPFVERTVKQFAGQPPKLRVELVSAFSPSEVARVVSQYQGKPHMYMFVNDDHSQCEAAYEAVKRTTMGYGVPSQVVKTSSIMKRPHSICSNIAAQLNTKVGNLGWKKEGCSFPGTMVVGIAQSHAGDGAGRGERKSIMSIASSYNQDLTGYTMGRAVLSAGATIAENLSQPFREHLEVFKKKNGGKAPKEIVFFREGGSEGEIPLIMELEVAAVRQALTDLGAKSTVTFFLVLRNSHLRIGAVDQYVDDGKKAMVSKAPSLGTVIDKGVVNPRGMEFYVLSQEANIGSPQAIKYKCLVYEGKDLNVDRYQQMANDLASVYFNWTGPVALPAPIMYAQRDAKYSGQCLLQDNGSLVDIPPSDKLGVPLL